MNIISLFKNLFPRRHYGQCQRCGRTDYLPWATEHGVRFCGHCSEKDALEYARLAGWTRSSPDNDRELRTGAHLLQMAKSLGWKDDGEGALEFMLRRCREVAFEDCDRSVLRSPQEKAE